MPGGSIWPAKPFARKPAGRGQQAAPVRPGLVGGLFDPKALQGTGPEDAAKSRPRDAAGRQGYESPPMRSGLPAGPARDLRSKRLRSPLEREEAELPRGWDSLQERRDWSPSRRRPAELQAPPRRGSLGSSKEPKLRLPSDCKVLGLLARAKEGLRAAMSHPEPLIPEDHLRDEPLPVLEPEAPPIPLPWLGPSASRVASSKALVTRQSDFPGLAGFASPMRHFSRRPDQGGHDLWPSELADEGARQSVHGGFFEGPCVTAPIEDLAGPRRRPNFFDVHTGDPAAEPHWEAGVSLDALVPPPHDREPPLDTRSGFLDGFLGHVAQPIAYGSPQTLRGGGWGLGPPGRGFLEERPAPAPGARDGGRHELPSVLDLVPIADIPAAPDPFFLNRPPGRGRLPLWEP